MKINTLVTHSLVIHTLVTKTLATNTLATKAIALRSLVVIFLVIKPLVLKVLVEKVLVEKTLIKNKLVKSLLLPFSCLLVLGCAQQPDYILAVSNQQIKQVQILDPHAPERNDGIIATLDGNYGKNVVKKYQRSIYDMKSSRQMVLTGQ